MDQALVKRVKDQIDEVLKDCEETGVYPTLCRLKSDPNGLAQVYEMVIDMIVNENIGIREAMGQIESSWE